MKIKTSALIVLALCLFGGNLLAGTFSRNIVGSNGVMPMAFSGSANFEALPQNAGLPSGIGAPLTQTYPQTGLPQMIPLGVLSEMTMSPNLPSKSPETRPATNNVEPVPAAGASVLFPRNQNLPFSKHIRRRELDIKKPLQNLRVWEKGAKKSVEEGRQISDDLWRLLSQGKSKTPSKQRLSIGELGTVPNSTGLLNLASPSQASEELTTEELGTVHNYASSVSLGRDPAASPVGEIPSPEDSNKRGLLRSWTAPSQVYEAGNGVGGGFLSGISEIGRFPVLIVMTVSRRILDFSLFDQMRGVYQGLRDQISPRLNPKWNFFVPFSSVSRSDASKAQLNAVSFPKLPPLSDSDNLARWWLSLSLLPILVAAILFRRSFL